MVHFDNIFVFQNLLKDGAELKIPVFFISYEVEEFKERLPVPALIIPFHFLFSYEVEEFTK